MFEHYKFRRIIAAVFDTVLILVLPNHLIKLPPHQTAEFTKFVNKLKKRHGVGADLPVIIYEDP